jgi:hypothetical protein
MCKLKDLMNENTLDKWPDVTEGNYVAVDADFVVRFFKEKPTFDHQDDCFVGDTLSRGTMDTLIARLAMKIAITHGVENSLLARPERKKHFWEPGYNQMYFYPCFDHQCTGINTMCRTWVGDEIDRKMYINGFMFPHLKYARWVVKQGKDPFILQSALAVNGLASYDQIFNTNQYVISLYPIYCNKEKKWSCMTYEFFSGYRPHEVCFYNENKVEEALAVELPDGRRLKEYLLGL